LDLNETLHSCNTLPADVHEGIWFKHHSIASGGYYSVRLLTVLVSDWFAWFMVFNTTFNNMSVISWRSVLLEEETGVP
jgi:hypothetical protein